MTDQPEITARAEGEHIKVSLRYPWGGGIRLTAHLSPQECFALQCQLSAAFQTVAEHLYESGKAAISIDTNDQLEIYPLEAEAEPKIKFREWL